MSFEQPLYPQQEIVSQFVYSFFVNFISQNNSPSGIGHLKKNYYQSQFHNQAPFKLQ